METRFVYVLIVKWTLHLVYCYQQINDANLHFLGQINGI